jgi:hypothetical protein
LSADRGGVQHDELARDGPIPLIEHFIPSKLLSFPLRNDEKDAAKFLDLGGLVFHKRIPLVIKMKAVTTIWSVNCNGRNQRIRFGLN